MACTACYEEASVPETVCRLLSTAFQESTSALRDAIVLTNAQGQIEWWNPAAEHILGFRDPDDIGQQITNLIRHPKFAAYYEQKSYQDPLTLPSPISEDRKLMFSITLYGTDNRLLVVRDNTRIFQLEQMTKDFVANVSHELRTPLTVISGYVETLQDSLTLAPEPPPPMLPRALGQMQSQSRRMSNIIEDLLILSKLETADSQMDLSPVDIKNLLSTVINDATLFSGERNHKIILKCRAGDLVLGNEKELRSAISNLVFNAVKYTPDGGKVEIKWSVELNTGYLTVKDNGIGMESQHIPRLTERFYRIDKSRHAATGGTGLGLAIVKHVLLRHDATLLIKSRVGQGSSFTCQFPHSRLMEPEQLDQVSTIELLTLFSNTVGPFFTGTLKVFLEDLRRSAGQGTFPLVGGAMVILECEQVTFDISLLFFSRKAPVRNLLLTPPFLPSFF